MKPRIDTPLHEYVGDGEWAARNEEAEAKAATAPAPPVELSAEQMVAVREAERGIWNAWETGSQKDTVIGSLKTLALAIAASERRAVVGELTARLEAFKVVMASVSDDDAPDFEELERSIRGLAQR